MGSCAGGCGYSSGCVSVEEVGRARVPRMIRSLLFTASRSMTFGPDLQYLMMIFFSRFF